MSLDKQEAYSTAVYQHQDQLRPHSLPTQTYKLGELFAGAGGMALGASQSGVEDHRFSHIWVNDIDKDACETLGSNLNIHKKHVFCCDVSEMDFDSLARVDGLVFGFPCNDFSVVGERKGISGSFGGLYRWGVKAVAIQQPLFFVAENVGGLASSGQALPIILGELEQAGYTVSRHTYKFEEYGVPQARHRIIIVGFRNDLGLGKFEHPDPTTPDNPITCKEALSGIAKNAPNNERTKQSQLVIERLKYIKPGQNAFTADLPEELRLKMNSQAKISQIYKRLNPDKPSYTVTGSGGGGTHIYHWEENRGLTNRERARLQSFPDDFLFSGGKESVRKQIGMAVPPKGAKIIFEAILQTLIANRIESQC